MYITIPFLYFIALKLNALCRPNDYVFSIEDSVANYDIAISSYWILDPFVHLLWNFFVRYFSDLRLLFFYVFPDLLLFSQTTWLCWSQAQYGFAYTEGRIFLRAWCVRYGIYSFLRMDCSKKYNLVGVTWRKNEPNRWL